MSEEQVLIAYTKWLQIQDAETFDKEWVLNNGEWYTNEQLVQRYLEKIKQYPGEPKNRNL